MSRLSAMAARVAPGPERLRNLGRATCVVLPVAMVVFMAFEWNGIPGQARDTLAYHRAGEVAAAGGNIYEPLPPPGPHEFTGEWFYLYPPPLAALLGFLPEVDYRTFDRMWLVLNFLAFWVLAAALGRIAGGAWSSGHTGIWGLALFFFPGTLMAIHFGNIELVALALVALGLAIPITSGTTLGLAAAFKVTPVWPLLTVLISRPRKVIPGLAVAVALAGGACLAAFGVAGTGALVAQWLRDVLPTVGQGQFWGESLARLKAGPLHPLHYLANLSIPFAPVQLAVMYGWDYSGGPLPGPVRAYLTATGIAAPLLVAWLTRRRPVPLQAAATLTAAVLAAPIVRPYALPVLLLLLATLLQQRRERRNASSSVRPPAGA